MRTSMIVTARASFRPLCQHVNSQVCRTPSICEFMCVFLCTLRSLLTNRDEEHLIEDVSRAAPSGHRLHMNRPAPRRWPARNFFT